jgi:hypothetical protein
MGDKVYFGGMTDSVMHVEADGSGWIEERQDCQSILDLNQRRRDHSFSGDSPEGTVREVANIPMVPYLDECRKAGVTPFTAAADVVMESMLVNPKYAKFISAPRVADPHIIIKGAR